MLRGRIIILGLGLLAGCTAAEYRATDDAVLLRTVDSCGDQLEYRRMLLIRGRPTQLNIESDIDEFGRMLNDSQFSRDTGRPDSREFDRDLRRWERESTRIYDH